MGCHEEAITSYKMSQKLLQYHFSLPTLFLCVVVLSLVLMGGSILCYSPYYTVRERAVRPSGAPNQDNSSPGIISIPTSRAALGNLTNSDHKQRNPPTERNSMSGEQVNTVVEKGSDANLPLWNFSLPWADSYSANYFKDSEWFQSLLKFTEGFDRTEPVVTVCADTVFIDGLLNWLVSAVVRLKQPLKNILVVTNRVKVCGLIEAHRLPFNCLILSAEWFIHGKSLDKVRRNQFTQLLVVRLSVMRILNHLGYDVLNLDSDAIVLKNPFSVLGSISNSDVIGTFGGQRPRSLFKKWGLVVCMGTLMMRSTPATEVLWEKMRKLSKTMDDQVLFNTALYAVNILWTATKNHYDITTEASQQGANTGWVGHTPSGLRVTLLPHVVACRAESCTKELRPYVYIWHHGRTKHKMGSMSQQAELDGVWFLKGNTESAGTGMGVEWLASLARS